MERDFQLDQDIVYLNNAAVAPWPKQTVDAVDRFSKENLRLGASLYPRWNSVERRLRERMARLINAPSPDDIALLKNTSEALSIVAHGLDWQAGDNFVGIAQEFPSNRIVWESLQENGVEIRTLDLDASQTPEQDLLSLCDHRTRLLSISAVQYARGLKLDLEPVGAWCRDRDILFCVDAIQQIGALPFDAQAIKADFVAADGHKWMLGPEGLALFYCRVEVRDRLKLRQFGWHMVEQLGDYDRRDWQPARSARRFECGSPNMLAAHALEASLELIERTGPQRIAEIIEKRVDRCIERCRAAGHEILSPVEPQRRAGIFCFKVKDLDQQQLYKALMQRKVICAQRGGGIRFSPHAYNTEAQVDRAFDHLEDIISRS